MTDKLTRILCVEVEQDIQMMAWIVLEALGGYTVDVCGSGAEAIERAPGFKPQFILLDAMMPGLDGPATFKALRGLEQTASIPIAFMTYKNQPGEITQYLELGAVDVIPMPFDPKTLASKVQGIWERCHA